MVRPRVLRFLKRFVCFFFLLHFFTTPIALHANPSGLKIQEIRIEGSHRLPSYFLSEELGLQPGATLDRDAVEEAQIQLYSLGLFSSVLVSLERGSERGNVILVITLEDDPTVLWKAAIGGTLKVTYDEEGSQTLAEDQPPLGAFGQIVSRNLFHSLHRGKVEFDIDGAGIYRHLAASYGFPKFSREGVQFDANISVTDVETRYLDVIGFGSRGSAIWSYDIGWGVLQYGLAMVANRPPRFSLPGFPSSVVGANIGFERETRLHGFLPSSGYRIAPNILIPPGDYENTVFSLSTEYTAILFWNSAATIGLDLQTVGSKGASGRFKAGWHFPFTDGTDKGAVFLEARGGFDRMEGNNLWGQSYTFGIRYHSFGFIAELAFKLTNAPKLSEFQPGKGS